MTIYESNMRPATLDEFCDRIFEGNGTYVRVSSYDIHKLEYLDQITGEKVAIALSYSRSEYNSYYIKR